MANGPIAIEDVGGSFRRFLERAAPAMRAAAQRGVSPSAAAIAARMRANAPMGPDAPHIKDAVTVVQRGGRAEIGFINASQPAAPGSDASIADVALFNEYSPNHQPFMRPAAEAEDAAFTRNVTKEVQIAAKTLEVGGGL